MKHRYHLRSRRDFVNAVLALCFGRSLLNGQQDPTFSAEVKVVDVLATVRNKKGELVRDLNKQDFALYENGRPQEIRYFARQTDLPLTLGMLVDTSMSQKRVLNAERGASFRFLDQVLRDGKDQVFIMQFDMVAQIRQELTSSRKKLEEALSFVDTPTFRELQAQSGGGTLLNDAVVESSKTVMQRLSGRKALIILSDGVDNGSEATSVNAVEAALRADTLIYSILFADSNAYGMFSPNGRGALQRLSQATGGGFFEVTKKNGIDDSFKVIEDELRSQYNLGYVSDTPVRISEFRRIQLSTKEKGLIVRARDRYWARR
jgi:VWFA-related protein